jgi:hypothetical protein
MKKSELRHIIRESLREIMGEEEKTDTNLPDKEDVDKSVEIIKQSTEITKEKVENDIVAVKAELMSKKGEIIQFIEEKYPPKVIAKFIASIPSNLVVGTIKGGRVLAIGAKEATNSKWRIWWWKFWFGNPVFMAAAAYAGFKRENFNPDIVAKTIKGRDYEGLEKLNPFNWYDLVFGDGKMDPRTFHQEVFQDGSSYYYFAVSMLIINLLLNYRKSKLPKKPGIFKRAAQGVKSMFKEEIEGSDDILSSVMAAIDADSNMMISKLQQIKN